ncbi:MAG: phosphatidate cytidylyltransferase [Alphaproteobacteria bacterium]|jgi:phosphatidate cytidylyltransferase|nr:phosphatidate cytidylyltransferase [Alphaproteobacteria bacterium]
MQKIEVGLIIILVGAYLAYVLSKIRARSEKTPVIPEYVKRPNWFFWGTIYLSLAFSGLSYLTNTDTTGLTLIWVFLATVCNDVFAYIFGSIIKGKKIAPKISPGKTWSGFIAAALSTTILSYFFAMATGSKNELLIMGIGFFMAFFAHFGDMLESSFKRYLKIKDTSNLIPGHGGILDRIDAVVMVALFISVLSIILGKSPLYL